jgi:NMD protein affecting ribosome stability and mRNA decay
VDDAPRCPNCGNPIEPEYVETGLCGDCYWDVQTSPEGTVDDDDGDG